MVATHSNYRGRFAPSPTGPLHSGSLIAALASYLDARSQDGQWLVRMEDLDPPREQPGAADCILQSLQAHGLRADEEPLWQSSRSAAYEKALAKLDAAGQLFHCECSRRLLGPEGACGGRCQPRQSALCEPLSRRVLVPADCQIQFADRLQGEQFSPLGKTLPDFTLKRKDRLYAYQLAVVVDDAAQDITHVVRGCDLLDSTPRQIFLQQLLGVTTPCYLHVPVITNQQGQKLSKQNQAPPLDNKAAVANLRAALRFLCQRQPPAELNQPALLLTFASLHWAPGNIPAVAAIPDLHTA